MKNTTKFKNLRTVKANYALLFPIYTYIIVLVFFGLNSCNKHEFEIPKEENSLEDIRLKFKKDSTLFYKTFDKKNYNFRQSLKRFIHWEKARNIENGIIAPISLVLPDGMKDKTNGNNILNLKALLVISRDSISNKLDYKMISYFPDSISTNTTSGMVFIEDYFKGNVEHTRFSNGVEDNLRTNNKKKNKIASSSTGCDFVKIGSVCVGDPSDISARDICSDRYEYRCNSSNEGRIPLKRIIDENFGGGSGGGDDNATTVLVIAPVTPIDLKKRLECFKNVPDNANTKYSVTLHVHRVDINSDKPGHAFLTIEKSNGTQFQRLSYGFYPQDSFSSGTFLPVTSSIGEESSNNNRMSDARYKLNLNNSQFNTVISKSLELSKYPYDLNDCNCTHYATDVFNSINPPTGQINNNGFLIPDGLYVYLSKLSSTNQNISIGRQSLQDNTNCNK